MTYSFKSSFLFGMINLEILKLKLLNLMKFLNYLPIYLISILQLVMVLHYLIIKYKYILYKDHQLMQQIYNFNY